MAITLILTTLFAALIVYGLQRNSRRQCGPRSPLAGSPPVRERDRDLERIRDELTALGGRYWSC
jgi:hypothetical protein